MPVTVLSPRAQAREPGPPLERQKVRTLAKASALATAISRASSSISAVLASASPVHARACTFAPAHTPQLVLSRVAIEFGILK